MKGPVEHSKRFRSDGAHETLFPFFPRRENPEASP